MKIVSWNTSFGRATAAALALADRTDADVLMLQEASASALWSGALAGSTVPDRDWGSWIFVRSGAVEPLVIEGYRGWVIGARWHVDNADAMYLFSVHSPTASEDHPRADYVTESRRIVAAICAQVPPSVPLVVGGDFNFKSFGERLSSETTTINRSEAAALAEFRRCGFSVAWRDCHRGEPLPQTLRWVGGRSIPYHCDGFLTRGFSDAVLNCDVVCKGADVDQSDHNPVVLSISRQNAA